MVAATAVLALTACTNASQTTTATQPGPSGLDATSIQKDEALAGLVSPALKAKGVLTVGSDTSYAPAEFLIESGDASGNDGPARVIPGVEVEIGGETGGKAPGDGCHLRLHLGDRSAEFRMGWVDSGIGALATVRTGGPLAVRRGS